MTYDYDPQVHHRRSIRLKGYDYTQPGMYFVTICVRDRECLFGDVVNGEMRLNTCGWIVKRVWEVLPSHYSRVELDAFAVMPNHVHGIVVLTEPDERIAVVVGAGLKPAPTTDHRYPLSEVIRALKTFSARQVNEARQTPRISVWQRDYYDHIIRDEHDLDRIRKYIFDNPAKWEEDEYHPNRLERM